MATIDEYLDSARQRLDRVSPEQVDDELAAGALLVDIRPQADRDQFGDLPGALVIEQNVLEWRLAPSSDTRVVDLAEGATVRTDQIEPDGLPSASPTLQPS